jgi:SAM-dependent methyltransferase
VTRVCVNIGCGASPTDGWINLDSSPSVRLCRRRLLLKVLRFTKLLSKRNLGFAQVAREKGIRYGDVSKRLPLADDSCDVVYSCHMMEHIVKGRVGHALQEMRRVLKPGGVIRIAVPDLRQMAEQYIQTGDADEFMHRCLMGEFWNQLESFMGRLVFLVNGNPSAHKWMYDGSSLVKLVERYGFEKGCILPEGTTKIPFPVTLNLAERTPESVFVEARKPQY